MHLDAVLLRPVDITCGTAAQSTSGRRRGTPWSRCPVMPETTLAELAHPVVRGRALDRPPALVVGRLIASCGPQSLSLTPLRGHVADVALAVRRYRGAAGAVFEGLPIEPARDQVAVVDGRVDLIVLCQVAGVAVLAAGEAVEGADARRIELGWSRLAVPEKAGGVGMKMLAVYSIVASRGRSRDDVPARSV